MAHSADLNAFLKKHEDTILNIVKCYGFRNATLAHARVGSYGDYVTWLFAVDKEVYLRARYYFSRPTGRLLIDTYCAKKNSDVYALNKVDYLEGVILD